MENRKEGRPIQPKHETSSQKKQQNIQKEKNPPGTQESEFAHWQGLLNARPKEGHRPPPTLIPVCFLCWEQRRDASRFHRGTKQSYQGSEQNPIPRPQPCQLEDNGKNAFKIQGENYFQPGILWPNDSHQVKNKDGRAEILSDTEVLKNTLLHLFPRKILEAVLHLNKERIPERQWRGSPKEDATPGRWQSSSVTGPVRSHWWQRKSAAAASRSWRTNTLLEGLLNHSLLAPPAKILISASGVGPRN